MSIERTHPGRRQLFNWQKVLKEKKGRAVRKGFVPRPCGSQKPEMSYGFIFFAAAVPR
jgi:hypothetical protein